MISHPTRRRFVAAGAALTAATMPQLSRANTLPVGTLRMLIGFPAGGGSDVMGRLIADKIRQRTNANIIVENKAGASGMIAAEALKNSPPDGTTIMYTPSATLVARMTNESAQFDPYKDFATTGLVGTVQTAYALSPSLGLNSFGEYVEWLKKNPDKANFGTTALGSFTHFVGVMLGQAIGIKLEPVPYRGAAPLISDLAAGHIAAGCGGVTDFLQHHRGNKLRIVVTGGSRRALAAPEIPTASELGFTNIVIEGWYTFFLSSKTPAALIDAWHREIGIAVNDPEVREKLVTLGLEPQLTTPADFTARMQSDLARWKQIIDNIGYKPA